jgi:hypothetical protein
MVKNPFLCFRDLPIDTLTSYLLYATAIVMLFEWSPWALPLVAMGLVKIFHEDDEECKP